MVVVKPFWRMIDDQFWWTETGAAAHRGEIPGLAGPGGMNTAKTA